MKKVFTCINCNNECKEKLRAFIGKDWCDPCVEKEIERSTKEDCIGSGPYPVRKRPPKYMLRPEDYAKYGY